MRNEPDYEGAIKKRLEKNLADVKIHLAGSGKEHKNLLVRISTFAKKFRFSETEIKEKIMSDKDDMFRAFFAVDPRKQNIDEKTALE